MSLLLGIAMGDFFGIGPEVTLKALASELETDNARFELIGDVQQTQELNRRLGLNLPLQTGRGKAGSERIFLSNPAGELELDDLKFGSPGVALAAVEWLKVGAQRALRKEIDAFVTAPVNKESIIRAGVNFVGQTELLSELAGTARTAMMLLGQDERGRWLRVVLATTHVPLKVLVERVTAEKIKLAIKLASTACRELGLPRARIGVCGLNPHAGEGGHMGTEEQTTIAPAVTEMRRKGLDVTGPMSADALFYYAYRGDYDVVVAMYHDQGLAPLKMVAFEQGVNWTLGLPFIRTSPDHGTAYDIAGQGKANHSSMLAAIRLAKLLARNRSM